MKRRPMLSADLKPVYAIEQQANEFPWHYNHFTDCLQASYSAFVFEDDSASMIGYTVLQKVVDELHVLNICVRPEVQGKGYGRQIMNSIIDLARSQHVATIYLEVRRSNLRAQALYMRTGFNEIAVRKNYYPAHGGREDAILMAMDLTVPWSGA